jgi:hypothetical protein
VSQTTGAGGLLHMNRVTTVPAQGSGRTSRVDWTKIAYWSSTVIVCAVMAFSAVNFNLPDPVGPMKGAFVHLGFPNYFKIELTTAKGLGVLALLLPKVPAKVREFAYAGFTITLISASIAHFSSGDNIMFVVDPLIFLSILSVSYLTFEKMERDRVQSSAHRGA